MKFFPFDADAIADLKHVLYLGQCKDAMNESLYKDRMRAAGLEGLAEHRSLAARVVMEAPDLTPSGTRWSFLMERLTVAELFADGTCRLQCEAAWHCLNVLTSTPVLCNKGGHLRFSWRNQMRNQMRDFATRPAVNIEGRSARLVALIYAVEEMQSLVEHHVRLHCDHGPTRVYGLSTYRTRVYKQCDRGAEPESLCESAETPKPVGRGRLCVKDDQLWLEKHWTEADRTSLLIA